MDLLDLILEIVFIIFFIALTILIICMIFVDASDEGMRKSEEKIENILKKYEEQKWNTNYTKAHTKNEAIKVIGIIK